MRWRHRALPALPPLPFDPTFRTAVPELAVTALRWSGSGTFCAPTEKEPDPKRPAFGKIVESIRVMNQRGETVLACDHILLAKLRSA